MKLNFKNIDKKLKQDIMTISLIIFFLLAFIFLYNSLFKTAIVVPSTDNSEIFFGRVVSSSEASEIIVKKLRRDIKNIENELNNKFYNSLREYKTSGNIIIKPGRDNPFILDN